MQDLGPSQMPRHLSGLLFDDLRAHQWVAAVYDGVRARALSASDALTIGVLLARCSTTGRDETTRAAEATLGRAVARRTLGSNVVRDAAKLAEEVASSAGKGKGGDDAHPWLRDAVPALLGALLCSDSPRAWALAEESAPLVAVIYQRDAHSLMPLLEMLVRASRASESSDTGDVEDGNGDGDRVAGAAAGARALNAALSAVPSSTLAWPRVWRALVDAAPVRERGSPDARAPTPLMSAVGRALARVSKSNDDRRDELCVTIESKLNGSARARSAGLDLLRAVLSAPERPFPLSHVALSVRWALHAASTVDESLETTQGEQTKAKRNAVTHGLLISAAATLVAAARYLTPADLAAIRDGWLAPRLRVQALVWRSDGDAGVPVCTVQSHVRVPSNERLPLDAVSALFHAELVLTARVDLATFKARVTRGETDLKDRRTSDTTDIETTRRGNETDAAVMVTLANALQSCLDTDGIDLGEPVAETRNALLRRLSSLLELQRGRSDERNELRTAATPSTPRVRVSAWISAVESVLSEDEDETRGVDPRAQAGVLKRAAEVVSVAFGLEKSETTGRVSAGAHDPSVALRALVTRDVLRRALKLAERLAPSVADSEDADEKRRLLADRIGSPRAGTSGNPGTGLTEATGVERWALAPVSTRASVVAGCFELCFAAAQAPSPPPFEASVIHALAAPALHLDTSEEIHDDPDAPDSRLVLLHWVTARATECGALRAAAPALSLAATLLSGLSEETAGACASMVVTAHASAALWGRADADPDEHKRRSIGVSRLGERLLSGTAEERYFVNKVVDDVGDDEDDVADRARRTAVLEAAHHLALVHNGAGAAVSTLADVVHVLSSTTNPVPSSAAATNAAVVLRLLAAHARRAVDGARSSVFAPTPTPRTPGTSGGARSAVDVSGTLRLGRLMCQTLDAVTATVKRNGFGDGSSARSGGETSLTAAKVAEALHGANTALAALVAVGNYFPQGGGGASSASSRFDDIAHAAYTSAGKLGAAVDARSIRLSSNALTSVNHQTTRLRAQRTALRALVALHGGERLTDNAPSGDDPESRASNKFQRKYGKLHWVDLTAAEPSSGESSESDASEEDDDDEMFCVRPNGGEGIAGWGLVDGAPFPEVKPAPIRKKKERRSSERDEGDDDADEDDDGDGEAKVSRGSVEKSRKKSKRERLDSEDPTSDADEASFGSKSSFVSLLEKLHRKAGGKLRIPTFCGVKLDLHKLFSEVQSRGGSEAVTEQRKWKQVALVMCGDLEGQTAASYAIRSKFEKTIGLHENRLAEILAKKIEKVKLREEGKTSEQENETP